MFFFVCLQWMFFILNLSAFRLCFSLALLQGVACDNSEYGWGRGFYPGVALLYGSELAINHAWTLSHSGRLLKSFGKTQFIPSMDCHTGYTYNVCEAAQLHTFHSDNIFSKFAFGSGKYVGFDASTLDVTQLNHYALYVAMRGNNMTTVSFRPPRC
eukprot:m.43014 g.43014  ORF g.43014 m.43014 type:complete len:156 (-) comp46605_c0_seq1:173-640(-)